MKVNILKKVAIIAVFAFVTLSCFYNVNAISLSDMEGKAQNFISKGSQQSNINYNNVTAEFKSLGQILTMIGAGVMVAVTAFMGIKYLTAGPEAQAKLKTQLIGDIVSGMVIFGAYFIWSIVLRIASTF